jgi:hypothetical protein
LGEHPEDTEEKNGQGFPSPEKVMGFKQIQQCELLITYLLEFGGIIASRLVWTSTHIGVRWVEPPITKRVLIIEQFSIFFHFLVNLSTFYAIGH